VRAPAPPAEWGNAVTADGRLSGRVIPMTALLDEISDGVMILDGQGNRTYSNPSLNALVGSDARLPLDAADPPDWLTPDQHDRYREHVDTVLSGRASEPLISLEWHVVTASGVTVPAAMKLIPVGNGKPGGNGIIWLVMEMETADLVTTDGDHRYRRGLWRIAYELSRLGLLTDPVTDRRVKPVPLPPGLEDLSRREGELLQLLLEGHRVSGIADMLCLSPHTVRNHIKSIFRKLDVHSQAELVALVRNHELRSG
jgi:DNA-binding CsgD family transcriptional regulator